MTEHGQIRGTISGSGSVGGHVEIPKQFGVSDHSQLQNRDKPEQHPISAITELERVLSQKLDPDDCEALTNSDIEALINNFV